MPEPVVVWDIDRTIVRSSLERRFVMYLREHGKVNGFRWFLATVRLSLRWPLPKWWQLKMAYLRGRTVEEVTPWIIDCWETSIKPALYEGSEAAIRRLREAGASQVLLSGTPQPLASPLAGYLGVSNVLAGVPEVHNGRYTGRLVAPHPQGLWKVRYTKAWLEQHGHRWEDVTAIADHVDDRFLLGAASRAVAVNPDSKLRDCAKRKGWRIIDSTEKPDAFTEVVDELLNSP